MSRLHINIGSTANDRTGDPLRTAFEKVNANFIELYATAGADVQIPAQTGHDGKFLRTNGTTLSWVAIIGDGTPVNADWDATTGLAEILNKPVIPSDVSELTDTTNLLSNTGNIAFDNDSISNSVVNNPIVLKTSKDVVGGEETATNSNPTPSNIFFGYLGFTPTINNVQVGWTVSGNGLVGTKTVTNVAQGGFENGYWTITVDGGDGSTFAYNGTYTFTQSSSVTVNQWEFADDGILTLPAGGDIKDSTGTSVLGTPTVLDGGNASTTF